MSILPLKLILTPLLIALASLVGRRWGPGVSGWLVGLPFTSGPVVFFLALSHGTAFAAAVATGALTGALCPAAFCLVYAWTARSRRWPVSVLAGVLAFAVFTLLLRSLVLPLAPLFLVVVAGLGLALRVMPRPGYGASYATAPPAWDLPVRMVMATGFVLLLTGAASALGARLSGLLTTFPLYAGILAVFAHVQDGPAAAINVLRGLITGLFAYASFFLIVAAAIERIGIASSFAAAIALALALQGLSLWIMRRSIQRDPMRRLQSPSGVDSK